jgi:NADH dehydrogenase/NADH:ubiquinone oxidoreductase subunit G
VGALTLKSFPFELRGWDIEKFESLDPTDSFGSSTRVYVSKDQIVQIEPNYNTYTFNTWLTDKGRQFFDGIFETWSENEKASWMIESWSKFLNKVIKILYIFDHCNKQNSRNHFFTIVFDNLGIEVLSMLIFISESYSFIALRRAEQLKINADIESSFQLNNMSDKIKISSSTLCLLISTNPRYEGYYLNLNLRQRVLKGNFKCLTIGSLINLTFPISFLGSNLNIIKTISEGNNFICQDLKFSTNPFLVYNNELFKRNDGKDTNETLKMLFYSNIFDKTWNGLNMLNSSLSDTGTLTLKQIPKLMLKDLNNFSSLYFLNVTTNNISNLKKITELKLLKANSTNNQQLLTSCLFLDQNNKTGSNLIFSNKTLSNYLYIPNSTFYENEETFINTEGFIKRTTKLIFKKKTKNNWQILRKFLKYFKNKLIFLARKDNQIIFFNSKKFYNFKNFINFQYYALQSLTYLNFYLNIKNKIIIINTFSFKPKTKKFIGTKLKYWLDDFFSGGKDEYSQHSRVLSDCSKLLRHGSTNFF